MFQKDAVKKLNIELVGLEEQKKQLFKKLLLQDLSNEEQEMANELKADIENKITNIQSQIGNISDSTYSWIEQSSNLLKLAKQAKELFDDADLEQKRQLLDFVSSNRVLWNGKVLYKYNKPFEMASKIVSENTKRPDKSQTVLCGSARCRMLEPGSFRLIGFLTCLQLHGEDFSLFGAPRTLALSTLLSLSV